MNLVSYGKGIDVKVEKIPCKEEYDGFYLKITIQKGNNIWVRNTNNYHMEALYDSKLTYNDRLEVVEALLPCLNDYTLSCKKVDRYYVNSFQIEYQGMPIPKSKRYNIAVDAMFAINRLFYHAYLHKVSTYPVLFDSSSMQEVNENPKSLQKMANIYREWLAERSLTKATNTLDLILDDLKYFNKGVVKWWDMMIVSMGIRDSII
ncbi:hypothetical protein GCM10011418_39760 [Sphingobacterium alkalisoli]|nr:hypothetical protein GCM10011418_39760 [Sphingobacterium alkalisoli]